MAEVQEMRGEKIYELDLNITGVTDYGVTLDSILSGKEKVPPQGTRFDVAFEGGGKGRIVGKVRGVDYLLMRADGRADLDVRATLETEDGHRIAAHIDGVATPRANEPIVDLVENVRLTTAAAKYDWVNSRQIWGLGTGKLGDEKDTHRGVYAVMTKAAQKRGGDQDPVSAKRTAQNVGLGSNRDRVLARCLRPDDVRFAPEAVVILRRRNMSL